MAPFPVVGGSGTLPRVKRVVHDWIRDWRERHQSRVSVILHAVGIPLTIAALVVLIVQLIDWRWDLWYRPLLLAVAGYFLQYLGHVYEGNEMGEVIAVKRRLGRPYVAVSPRYRTANPTSVRSRRRMGQRLESAINEA